jgi:hypothetical protein
VFAPEEAIPDAIVLTHFSLRYRPAEIRKALDALPAEISDRV